MRLFLTSTCLVLTFVFVGCGTQQPNNATQSGTPSAASGPSEMELMEAELAKLSPEDASSAKAQHVCPVSDKMLGTMGPPKKVDVDSRQVWICCDACREELLANGEKYLAKLNKE